MNKKLFVLLLLIIFLFVGCGKNEKKEANLVKYCENGALEEDKCKVVNTIDPVSISCEEENFKFNEETRKCENVIAIPANRRIGCKDEENYVLKNGACYPKSGKGATKYRINIYSCPDSGILKDNKCEFVDEQEAIVVCPQGYEVNKEKATCEVITYENVKTKEE